MTDWEMAKAVVAGALILVPIAAILRPRGLCGDCVLLCLVALMASCSIMGG